ncbi:MAG TPA: hypothetical protein VEY67_09725 [Candidatus Dormibacteraeota bacterium]|nr:hypothetical protein [Candidatus Dormibacteraeota bacterium]
MDPQLLIVLGFIALAAGALVLLSFGPRFRVGRLLAATPQVPVAAAIEAASSGRAGYIRVAGRIDSETDFEDAAHRPLVLRRTRIQLRRAWAWRTVDAQTEAVPFQLNEGLHSIGVDARALGDGLVVVPRESLGSASDLPERVPAGTDPRRPVRAVVEQVSAVDHAVALGVPVRSPDGATTLTAGMGRPLVLTTLEPAEAMRILAGGDRTRTVLAACLLATGLVLVVSGLVLAALGVVL